MKDKIVIETDGKICKGCDTCLHETRMVAICNLKNNLDIDLKKEKQPETFEELKELCENFDLSNNKDYIKIGGESMYSNILFCNDGAIMLNTDCCFAQNKTPQQMWQIIQGLIGE